MRRFHLVLLSCMVIFSVMAEDADSVSIRNAIECWMAQYPESQYCDVYKNFFQDNFGPGHILSNKDSARRYLEAELANTQNMDGSLFEPTGHNGRFVRVNLSLIRDGIIPIDDYFSAFVESMENIEMPTTDEWKSTWSKIDAVITAMNIHFPDEESDRQIVKEALESEKFAVHHSRRYNATYSRHYRIIRLDIAEKLMHQIRE